jgi:hypothetical protein
MGFFCKFFMAFNRLAANANNNRIWLIKYIREIPEKTDLSCAIQASILRIEKDNQFFLPKLIA